MAQLLLYNTDQQMASNILEKRSTVHGRNEDPGPAPCAPPSSALHSSALPSSSLPALLSSPQCNDC
jgi:hypothetical protein